MLPSSEACASAPGKAPGTCFRRRKHATHASIRRGKVRGSYLVLRFRSSRPGEDFLLVPSRHAWHITKRPSPHGSEATAEGWARECASESNPVIPRAIHRRG